MRGQVGQSEGGQAADPKTFVLPRQHVVSQVDFLVDHGELDLWILTRNHLGGRQKNVTSALGVRRKAIRLSCSKTHRVCDFLPPPALSEGNTEGFPLWEVWTHGGAESLRSPKYPDTTQRLRYPAADWSLTGRRDNRCNQLLNTLLLKILQTTFNNYKICFY